jgi:FG-GAP-like repeat
VRLRKNGLSYIYPGDGSAGFRRRVGPFGKYAGVRWLAIGGQLAESRKADLVAVGRGGVPRVFANSGQRNIGRITDTGVTAPDANLVLNVGDWNGDGRADVMTRNAGSGKLWLHANLGHGQLAPPVRAGRGWAQVDRVTAVGDMSGDGNPDLMARAEGEYRVYLGDGEAGFDGHVTGGEPLSARVEVEDTDLDWLIGLVDVNGDDRGDVIIRDAENGYLHYLRGKRKGFSEPRFITDELAGYDLGG